MLGTDLLTEFKKAKFEVVGLSHSELDITKGSAIERMIKTNQPHIVINAAAYTNVDGAETEQKAAYSVNVDGPTCLSRACDGAGIKLIHFSTDQVFDGDHDRPWTESDRPNPLNYYAATKLEGEKAVLEGKNHLVVRVQWLYGEKKERFTQLKNKPTFSPFSDQWGAPTWTRDIAKIIPRLLDSSGLFHFSYDDFASWSQVFQFVKEKLGLTTQLIPRRTAELNLPARRPLYCVLSNHKLKSELKTNSLGSWRDALSQFLENMS